MSEGMIQFLIDHLSQIDLEIRRAIENWRTKSLFGNCHSPEQRKLWTTDESITQCTLYGKQALCKNVIIAMFKERIGLGPDYNEVMTCMLPPFINCFYYLLRMIPPQNILLYPWRAAPLICNHLTFPRQILTICGISARTIPDKDHPGYCKLCQIFWCKHTIAYLKNHPRMDDGFQEVSSFGFSLKQKLFPLVV